MKTNSKAKLLRIFVGESDKHGHVGLYEKIVVEARQNNLAGATVYKGIMGFGSNSMLHTAKVLRLSEDLPLVVEIVDTEEKINSFIPIVERIFEESNAGGLITIEAAEIIKYTSTK